MINKRTFLKQDLFERFTKNIRVRMLLVFCLCSLGSWIAVLLADGDMKNTLTGLAYAPLYEKAFDKSKTLAQELTGKTLPQSEEILRNRQEKYLSYLLVDMQGNILAASDEEIRGPIRLQEVIISASDEDSLTNSPSYVAMYPLLVNNDSTFIVAKYKNNGGLFEIYIENLSWPVGQITFLLLFYLLSRRKMQEIQEIGKGLAAISRGDLQRRIRVKSNDEIGMLASNINEMAQQLQQREERERQSEREKEEMIVNISHDLRTPLTSIIGYNRLIKEQKWESETQLQRYYQIIDSNLTQLQRLIEGLFVYTTLINRNTYMREEICLKRMLEQLTDELGLLATEENVIIAFESSEKEVQVKVNSEDMVRAIQNLLTNAIKYCHKPSTVHVQLNTTTTHAHIVISNIGDAISEELRQQLFERFFTLDPARQSRKGGVGLGLAIARLVIEQHQGKIWMDCNENLISFHIELERVVRASDN